MDPDGNTGRQTHAARIATLAALFDIVRARKKLAALQTAERIDRRMANHANGFNAQSDRKKYGVGGSTYGRVTLYTNPHDQVISAATERGIGWLGLTDRDTFNEIKATRAQGVLVQRVFAQGYDPPGAARDSKRVREPGDPYATVHKAPDSTTDAALGDRRDEASLRYEQHAMLRLRAKREKLYAADAKVVEEDDPSKASAKYTAWRTEHIKVSLAETVDAAATDHSTIFTNPMHSERVLAYDVAVGVCQIPEDELRVFMKLADWRHLQKLDLVEVKIFESHFTSGSINEVPVQEWVKSNEKTKIPASIQDERG